MWDEIRKDMDNMEDIMVKLGDRSDIWQDRFIWAIAKAIYDGLKKLIKMQVDLEMLEREVLNGKHSNS